MVNKLRTGIPQYEPVPFDSIDSRLAQEINNSESLEEILKLLEREKQGVYKFGTKRVLMKLQGDQVYGKYSNL